MVKTNLLNVANNVVPKKTTLLKSLLVPRGKYQMNFMRADHNNFWCFFIQTVSPQVPQAIWEIRPCEL